MSLKKLSKNEQLVLYGLVKNPLLNDRELAESLKLNISTLTAIKNRLKKNKYFTTIRIPMLQNVGCELMGVATLKLNIMLTPEQMTKIEKEFKGKYPEIVFMMYESEFMLCITIGQNFTEIRKVVDEIKAILLKHDALDLPGINNLYFPYQTTRIFNYFDYGLLLQRAFGIKEKEDKKKEGKPPAETPPELKKLSKIEKIVYYGLIKYPDYPDKKIAEYTNVTRQVVARLRKEFETDNLIRTVKIPNLQMLGFQIVSYATANINMKVVQEVRKKGSKMILQDIPTIFWASGSVESVIISAMQDFDDYKDLYVKGFGHLKRYNFIMEMPEPKSLSVNYLKYIKNHDYAPLVKKVFEITEVD
jgi:DNA-binding MarR family transcriptional regulator